MMPSAWRRWLCSLLGHAFVAAGVQGVLEFPVCRRCGKLAWYAARPL